MRGDRGERGGGAEKTCTRLSPMREGGVRLFATQKSLVSQESEKEREGGRKAVLPSSSP